MPNVAESVNIRAGYQIQVYLIKTFSSFFPHYVPTLTT